MLNNVNGALRLSLGTVLAHRLEGLSPQFGKTVLMKFAYLLQEVYGIPLGYRFSLYTYGPYSKEVLADLDRAESLNWVSVNIGADDAGYNIEAGEKSPGQNGVDDIFLRYDRVLQESISHFGHFRAKDLELRTTAAYMWKTRAPQNESDATAVVTAVHDLKPHFTRSEIDNAIKELIASGTIKSAG